MKCSPDRANFGVFAVCNDCDFLPISPVLLDTERNYKALYRSWIDVLPRLNCSVVFVSEDPVSGEECFYYVIRRENDGILIWM